MHRQQAQATTRRPAGNFSRNQNQTRFKSSTKLGPVAHTVLVALMVTVLGLIYLTQATKATGYDYEAKEVDDKIMELSIQKNDLEIEDARLTSLENIKDSKVAKDMAPAPTSTEYVN